MYWTIDKQVFLVPLSLITFLEDDVYSPIDLVDEAKFIDDIKTNGQTQDVFLTEDNLCIGGRRICKALKAIGKTHANAQRVMIEPKFYPVFLYSNNNYRLKTKLECYREVKIILATIPRHRGTPEPPTPAPTEDEKPVDTPKSFADRMVAGEKMISPEDLQYYENNKGAIEVELKSKIILPDDFDFEEASVATRFPINVPDDDFFAFLDEPEEATPKPIPTPIPTIHIPPKPIPTPIPTIPIPTPVTTILIPIPTPVTTIPIPTPAPPKRKTPIQKAVKLADNGTNSTEFQRMQYIERIDEKYPGNDLLQLLATKCPNVDLVWKAAKKVEERNNQKENPTPALKIPTTTRYYNLFNKSNWEMDEVENNSIDFTLTSHPYWKQIKYTEENKNEMGQEPTVKDHIINLVKTYTEVFKKTRRSGNLFVNMKGTFDRHINHLVEQKFVTAMCGIGWHHQDTFIWNKKGGGKRSGNNNYQPPNSYEQIFWFTKTPNFYYKPIEIPIPKDEPITVTFKAAETRVESKGLTCYDKIDVSRAFTSFTNVIDETYFLDVINANSAATDSRFMNKLYGEHVAPFPMNLPLLFLLQFCPDNGRALEPFLGRGAGLVAALMLGHTCFGYETVPKYFETAQKLLADVVKDIDYYREQMREIELQYQQKFNKAA